MNTTDNVIRLGRLVLAAIVALPGGAVVVLALAVKVVGIVIRGLGEAIDEGRRPFYWLADKVAGEVEHG